MWHREQPNLNYKFIDKKLIMSKHIVALLSVALPGIQHNT